MPLPARGQYLAPRNIRRVLVVGGTHGNERTGVHVVQYIDAHPRELPSGTVTHVDTLFGNPRAIQRNSRYIDQDLNRCYTYDYAHPLSEAAALERQAQANAYEEARALEVRRNVGALTQPLPFLIDLHTTTSNMGNCLIIADEDPWTLHLCAGLLAGVPRAHVLSSAGPRAQDQYTSSMALNHITLEVGPVQQGVPHPPTVRATIDVVREIIRGVDRLNGNAAAAASASDVRLTLHRILDCAVDFPRDARGIPIALVHAELNGTDFRPLRRGMPLFQTLDGEVIRLEPSSHVPEQLLQRLDAGESIVPVFIGEAAYVEKGTAFLCAQLIELGGGSPSPT